MRDGFRRGGPLLRCAVRCGLRCRRCRPRAARSRRCGVRRNVEREAGDGVADRGREHNARPGPSNVASTPSPVDFTSWPRNRSSSASTTRSWAARTSLQCRSRTRDRWSVEPTMSVNMIIASTRSESTAAWPSATKSAIASAMGRDHPRKQGVLTREQHRVGAGDVRRDIVGLLMLSLVPPRRSTRVGTQSQRARSASPPPCSIDSPIAMLRCTGKVDATLVPPLDRGLP